ncbi:MAG: hypothetical protein OQL19_01585 [Gammaproteobacteria bacterium]|nr:hypothetical protein [Gammaproteobacteria bacterium]
MENLRKPFFYAASIFLALALLIELSSGIFDFGMKIPGLGIPSIALIDSLLIFVIFMMMLNVWISPALIGKISGISTLIFSLIILLTAIALLFFSLLQLTSLIALLLAFPFGTAAYFATFAGFDRGGAAATLSLLMTLKVLFAVFLVLAQQRFLENKGLIFLIFTMLIVNILVGFLHGFPPGFLVSIIDALAAIIISIIAIIWSINFFIRSIPAILKII